MFIELLYDVIFLFLANIIKHPIESQLKGSRQSLMAFGSNILVVVRCLGRKCLINIFFQLFDFGVELLLISGITSIRGL